jgi:signal transduction histidine kinase
MIKKLKRRFIALAMASLVVLMTVIVAGMNIINYNTVVSEADDKLAALSVNGGMLPFMQNDAFGGMQDDSDWAAPQSGSDAGNDAFDDDDWDAWIDDDDYDDIDAATREGLYGRGKPFSSRDEAEETRFFSVLLTAEESVVRANTDRIYAVDDSAAAGYAKKALEAGGESGWVDEYRFAVTDEGNLTRITFLDCTSSLAAFRQFLIASIIMSVAGLLVMIGIICYFAGRIVRPVAESYDKQKRFITDAGHEIKTPLAVIQNYSSLLNAENLPEHERKEYAVAISAAAIRLNTLITNVLRLSRLENQQIRPKSEQFDLGGQLTECLLGFENIWEEKEIEIEPDIEDDVIITSDRELLSIVWNNLLSNAFKFTEEGGTVSVSLRTEDKNAVVSVKDTGCGMPPETVRHVFDKFYQGDTSHSIQGNGLGLALVKRIVDIVGGEIRVESEPGEGSTFTVKLTGASKKN